jgi:hypothetical protein
VKLQLKDLYLNFYKCSHFIELLRLFYPAGEFPDEWEEKRKYYKFKAGLGISFLQQGKVIPEGNPFSQARYKDTLAKEKEHL